jgi:F-type H+-transporting ATPase subunit b
MQADWWTLALQAVNFLVLVWLLQRFLYKPVLAVIERRKALAAEAFDDAAQSKAAADTEREALEAERAGLAQEHQGLAREMHETLESERKAVLAAAREEAEELLESARADIEQERRRALDALRVEVAQLASDLASTVLAQVGISPAVQNRELLGRVDASLATLAQTERERLRGDLQAPGSALTVVSARGLSPQEQAGWRSMLSRHLGDGAEVIFAEDPALLGGVELRFPHALFSFAWSELLDQGKRDLTADESTG